MVTVYTLAYNEELMIQFMIDHYRNRFPNCHIVIFDNESSDNTVKIALKNSCEVLSFNTNKTMQDSLHMKIKNTCWKNSNTDWVVVCDLDELLDIREKDIIYESKVGSTIISTQTYDMINMHDNDKLKEIKYAVPSPQLGKSIMFNQKFIREMDYGPGAHSCKPKGKVKYSQKKYNLLHYASLGETVTINRYKTLSRRLSHENITNGWGKHYLMTESEIRIEYEEERKKTIKIL